MRICMLVRNACVRDARVLREAGALAAAGHDVLVIATLEPGVPREEERDGFRIQRVEPVAPWIRRLARRPPIPASASPAATEDAKPPLKRRPPALLAIRDRLVTRQLAEAALGAPADAYHAHDANTLEAAARAAHRHRAPLVYDAHELYPELSGLGPRERARWERLERRLIREPARVITVSESLADEFVRRYEIARPEVIVNCPERSPGAPDRARSPLAPLRAPGEMLALYVGGMSPNRGLEALVDAAGRARGWRLVMMGWGRLHDELRARAPSVAFVDPVPPDRVVEAASAADVGVIPYVPAGLNNALSLPNKLFEYVHAGLAVAASDLVELRRFIDRHEVGVLFEPGSTDGMAAALDGLAADHARLEAMRAAAARAAPLYDWFREKTKLLEIYEALSGRITSM